MRKAVDASGKDKAWHRCFPGHSASIAGLLTVFCYQSVSGRPATLRGQTIRMVQDFLSYFLEGQDILIHVLLDENAANIVQPGQPLADDMVEIAVDSGQVWTRQLCACSDPRLGYRMQRLVEECRAAFALPRGPRLPLSALLIWTWRNDELWLFKQLILQVSLLVDEIAPDKGWSQNPLAASDLPGARWPSAVVEALALGEGHASASRDALPSQHVESFNSLRPSKRRWGIARSLVGRMNESICLRYEDVGRTWMQHAKIISVALDASRIGRQEILVLIVAGVQATGEVLAMLAPPQVYVFGGGSGSRGQCGVRGVCGEVHWRSDCPLRSVLDRACASPATLGWAVVHEYIDE